MGERYIDPSVMGIEATPTPVKKEQAEKGALRRYAEKAFAALAVVATMHGAMEGKAHAEETKAKDTAGEKMKLRENFQKEIAGGKARFTQGVERVEDQGWQGDATFTRVEVIDEGNPNVEGDELILEERLFRFDGDDGQREWERKKQPAKGDFGGKWEKEFGKVDMTTTSMQRVITETGRQDSALRLDLNARLRSYTYELKVVRALREIGKENTPEAKYLLEQLQEQVRSFQQHFPDIPLNRDVLAEVFGSKGK